MPFAGNVRRAGKKGRMLLRGEACNSAHIPPCLREDVADCDRLCRAIIFRMACMWILIAQTKRSICGTISSWLIPSYANVHLRRNNYNSNLIPILCQCSLRGSPKWMGRLRAGQFPFRRCMTLLPSLNKKAAASPSGTGLADHLPSTIRPPSFSRPIGTP